MLLHMALFHSSSWLSNIPSHIWFASSLFIHLSVNTEVEETFHFVAFGSPWWKFPFVCVFISVAWTVCLVLCSSALV